MHIIVLAVSTSSMRGGIEKSMLDVCRGLHQRGHTISLIYEQEGDQISQYQEYCHYIGKIESFRLSKQNPLASILNLLQVIRQVPTLEDTVIYTSQYYTFFFGAVLARLKNAPLIGHLRLPAPAQLQKGWKHSLILLKERITLKSITRYIAISRFIQFEWTEALQLNPDKFDVVYNGINTDVFKPSDDIAVLKRQWNISPQKKVIVYVGRLDQHKGIETLIQAFALLRQQRSDIHLIIAGKSILEGEDYEQSLHNLVAQLGLASDVQFPGYAKSPVSLYQLGDVTVLPSTWAEPFGRTIIESFACGTPVAAARSGGIPEAFSPDLQKLLFNPGDEHGLAFVLSQTLDWRVQEPDLGKQCRDHAIANFQIEQTVEGVERSLMKAMKRPGAFNEIAMSNQGASP